MLKPRGGVSPGQYHSTVMATYRPCVYFKIIIRLGCSSDLAQPQSGLAGGPAPGGALRGGRGCRRVRQAEIDDRERHRRGAALSCCGTRLSLRGGRGGPCRRGICQWPPAGRLESNPRVDLQGRLGCGALGVRALGRFQTRGSFGQSESGSASLSTSRALDSELKALHGCTWIPDATDLNRAPAVLDSNFSSAGGSTVGVVPKRCCLGHT